MSLPVRDGGFDLAIVAGPRVSVWPSVGVRTLSAFCSEMGLTVGLFGGPGISVKGVIPLPGKGGVVIAADQQGRIHRIQARSVVRVSAPVEFPTPFPGWRSEGLIPLKTAKLLLQDTRILWSPATVILGTGNGAFRFGSELLEKGASGRVVCVESLGKWDSKDYAGWEVERRRFEMLGGRIIHGKPVRIERKGPLLWDFRLQDAQGVRIIETGRVVSAGPFHERPGVSEYPPGSLLFEMDQTAEAARADDVEGWSLEEERGRWLGGKISKSLVIELGEKRDTLERMFRRARTRIKQYRDHLSHPSLPRYEGKWLSAESAEAVRASAGVPKQAHRFRMVASIECVENVPCNLCEQSCPDSAIKINRFPEEKDGKPQFLLESDCTACGICLKACPSGSIAMLMEPEQSFAKLTLPWRGQGDWKAGELAVLVNRRGERLGSGRVTGILETAGAQDAPGSKTQLVQLEVPSHLVWQARGLRRQRPEDSKIDEVLSSALATDAEKKVEILLEGERRLVQDGVSVSQALFELGRSRPQDVLYCKDGSCGLCEVIVDSVRQNACQTRVRRGMALKFRTGPTAARGASEDPAGEELCPCMGIRREQIVEKIRQGKLTSPEAVLAVMHVGEGRCHGQLCIESFRRVLMEEGIDVSSWIDWRFPWVDWVLPGQKNQPV